MDVYDFIKESYPLLIKIRDNDIALSKLSDKTYHLIFDMIRNFESTKEEMLSSRISLWWSLQKSYKIKYDLTHYTENNKLKLLIDISDKDILIRTESDVCVEDKEILLSDFEDLMTNKELFILTHGRINIPFVDLFTEYNNEILKDLKMIANRNENK